ncbi:MAG TPA: MbcA/ParS/Xre antitoxin family protein [Longimicrobiales bacterium]|nr:MbcA/ParS/Xre antitoxin family protein [Longimicrobiales bacterium]
MRSYQQVGVRRNGRAAFQVSAARWLRKPNRGLDGKRPLDLLESDLGARVVERVLGRIERGLVA